MKISELTKDLPYLIEIIGNSHTEIHELCMNSRDTCVNGLFFCIKGHRYDAHFFANQAVLNGCVALVVERVLRDVEITQILVSDSRAAMSRIASAFYGHPAKKMKLIGITGTKGKTTTSYMLKGILEKAGHLCGLIGTTGNIVGDTYIHSELTTPDPIDLHHDLKVMADMGAEYVVMEVSAHALAMKRLDGLVFEAGVFTNFSRDHLDYFGDMEHYLLAKKSFFCDAYVKNASYNADDEIVVSAFTDVAIPYTSYGICTVSDLCARDIEFVENGVSMCLQLSETKPIPVRLNMVGMFNVYNALAASSLAMILGISADHIKEGLEALSSVPGRAEVLQTDTTFTVIRDYSHSPDALENILKTAKAISKGRVIVLFGCGGDRDQGKRIEMGLCGGRLADYCILTSDNPRTEDPMDILNAIEEGIKKTNCQYTVIENRRDAIEHALSFAGKNDIVILAGKGDETYQDIMGIKRPFNEKDIVKEILAYKNI